MLPHRHALSLAVADPEGVLGATLCMLSCALASGSAHLLPQVAANLAWLSGNPRIGAELRVVCHRLWEHWESASQQPKTH
jgi:hypothetical protein